MAKDANKVTVKRVFGSLINNASAVDGGKYSPWWIGLIMFIIGIILPVLPLFVSAANTKGTSFMASCEYGLGMDKTFGETINGLDGTLTFDNVEKSIKYNPNTTYSTQDNDFIGAYISTAGNTNGQYELRVYYSTLTDEKEISDFVQKKENIAYKKGTIEEANGENIETYIPSSIYFFEKTFAMDIYASNSVERKALMNNLADLNCFDYDKQNLKAYFVGESFDKSNKDNRITAVNNLKSFIDTTYESTRVKTMWLGSLIYVGIYVAMNLFMALMIFLMSRGKNNPNNCLNFWHCIKIDWWSCFCPGLLGMIFGFIFSGSAVMLYVMFLAMRTMWLTMRELRPQY